jgi:hypothetical protein
MLPNIIYSGETLFQQTLTPRIGNSGESLVNDTRNRFSRFPIHISTENLIQIKKMFSYRK